MKKYIISGFVVIILVILILLKILSPKKAEIAVKAANPNAPIPADIYIVQDTTVEYGLAEVGSLKSNESTEIVSEINRKIVDIKVADGSIVQKGQLLFKLDDEDIVSKINKLEVDEKLAIVTESREKIRLSKGGISQQVYDEVSNNLDKIRAEIKILKVDLSKTEIRAPFKGKVGLRNISVGAFASPNIVLASLHDNSIIKIDFSVPEQYFPDIKPGNIINFRADYSNSNYSAKITATEPKIDEKSRTLLIRAVIDNRNNELIPGSFVKISLNLRVLEKSFFIPTEAIFPTIKGYETYILKNGKALLNPIKAGLRTNESVQIIDGLKQGDTVITTNLLRIKPGSVIKVKNAGL